MEEVLSKKEKEIEGDNLVYIVESYDGPDWASQTRGLYFRVEVKKDAKDIEWDSQSGYRDLIQYNIELFFSPERGISDFTGCPRSRFGHVLHYWMKESDSFRSTVDCRLRKRIEELLESAIEIFGEDLDPDKINDKLDLVEEGRKAFMKRVYGYKS